MVEVIISGPNPNVIITPPAQVFTIDSTEFEIRKGMNGVLAPEPEQKDLFTGGNFGHETPRDPSDDDTLQGDEDPPENEEKKEEPKKEPPAKPEQASRDTRGMPKWMIRKMRLKKILKGMVFKR